MNKKACIAGGLASLGVAVWGPQLLGASSDREPALVEEVGADGGGASGAPFRAGRFSRGEPAGGASGGTPEPDLASVEMDVRGEYNEHDPETGDFDDPEDPEDLLVRLQDTLGLMESFVPSAEGRDLRALVQDLQDAELEAPTRGSLGPLDVAPAEGPGQVLRAFALEHPLRGVLHGPDRSLVLLGHRVASVGDRFDGGRVTVEAIGPRGIRIGAGGESLEVDLPPFVAGGSSSSSEDDEEYGTEESAGEDEDLSGGQEGGA